jgi:cell division protein FtsL
MTRRQLSHHARAVRRQRIVLFGGIGVVVVVIALVVVGILSGLVFPMNATVLQINDQTFDLHYFIQALEQAASNDPSQSVQTLSSQIIGQMQTVELLRQGAANLGVTIPDDNVTAQIQSSGLPDTPFYRDVVRYNMLKTQLQNVYFADQQQNPAPQVNIQGLLLEDATVAEQVRPLFAATDNITDLVKQYGVNYYSQNAPYGDFGWHPEPILQNYFGSKIPLDWAFQAQAGDVSPPLTDNTTSKKIGYWLLKVNSQIIPPTTGNVTPPASANVTGILLGSLHEAQVVKAQLAAGGDLAAISANLSNYSVSQENGGQLGVLTQPASGGTPVVSPTVDAIIFNPDTPKGVWLDPVKDDQFYTKNGVWLIKVVDTSPSMALSSDDLTTLASNAIKQALKDLGRTS